MVDKLLLLNAVLRVYHANFLNLHWNSVGEEFNDAHKAISTDYYELCDKYVDSTAEMITRLGRNPYNYKEVYDAVFPAATEFTSDEETVAPEDEATNYSKLLEYSYPTDNEPMKSYVLIDSNTLYHRIDIIRCADTMLGDVVKLIEDCLSDPEAENVHNAGIKSDLEAMHSEFDLQYRYINRRRGM